MKPEGEKSAGIGSSNVEQFPTPRQREIAKEIAEIQGTLWGMEREIAEGKVAEITTHDERRRLENRIIELHKESAKSGW